MAKTSIAQRGRKRQSAASAAQAQPSLARLPWVAPAVIFLAAVSLLSLFAGEISDTDFWWHLKTGQYIAETHALPATDPFAYTTPAAAAYPGEQRVRRFNLTHEWLSQLAMYAVYALSGFPGIVLVRAILLIAICGLAGFLAARLSASLPAGILAACAAASVMVGFTADRPGVVTFLGVAVFVTLLELRRGWWALPPLMLVWANCHGGFFLGWVALLAYSVTTRERRLWLATACAILVSGVNPNGFGVIETLLDYRRSPMTRDLIEWHRPSLWGAPYGFDILLYLAALALALGRKRVQPAQWILFAAFATASLMAFRNAPLIGFLAPVLIAAYFPWRISVSRGVAWAGAALAPVAMAAGFGHGGFQLRVAQWTIPEGAAQYLAERHIRGPIFNTYEEGGYLIWKLWPRERVFMDGRALSESVYRDYNAILYNAGSYADQVTGPRAELLDRYGVQTVIMNTMDYVSGTLYPLAIGLANPVSDEWKLVYDDPQALIFTRRPPAGVSELSNKLGRVLRHMDRECEAYIANSPETPLCARTLARYWMSNGVNDEAAAMLRLYLAHAPKRDEAAERMLRDAEAGLGH
jgi:hypothetical protein